jgi:hypothetical protein
MGIRNMGKKQVLGNITLATVAYNVYSQYKTLGHNLSGASHAGQIQQRKGTAVNKLSTVVGAAIIHPLFAAGLVANAAWQLSQTNRRELFEIKRSQIIANVMQERLVKDTIQRRF